MSTKSCTKRKQYGDRTYKARDVLRIYCNYLSNAERAILLEAFNAPVDICEYTRLPKKVILDKIRSTNEQIDAVTPIIPILVNEDSGLMALFDEIRGNLETTFELIDARTQQIDLIRESVVATIDGQPFSDEEKEVVKEELTNVISAIVDNLTASEKAATKAKSFEAWLEEMQGQLDALGSMSDIVDRTLEYFITDDGLLDSVRDTLTELEEYFKGTDDE